MTIAKGADGAWNVRWLTIGKESVWLAESKNPPVPAGASKISLKSVSCTAESACTAVGSYYLEAKAEYKTLADRWNGTSWSQQSTPNPPEGSASSALLGVSCGSSASCMAVGKVNEKPFAERWNGSEWTLGAPPKPSGATSAGLEGVSCISASCTAVGTRAESGTKTLTETWNGSTWSVVASPNPAELGSLGAYLSSVSCASTTSCIAVGRYFNEGLEAKTLAESWNGSGWTIQSSPNASGEKQNSLLSISCSSPAVCTAVGYSSPSYGSARTTTLGERWNGSEWSLQSTPNPQLPPAPVNEAQLEGVSCASSTMCIAVGNDHHTEKGFAQLWDGSKWKV